LEGELRLWQSLSMFDIWRDRLIGFQNEAVTGLRRGQVTLIQLAKQVVAIVCEPGINPIPYWKRDKAKVPDRAWLVQS
jgi:hypothetical protein